MGGAWKIMAVVGWVLVALAAVLFLWLAYGDVTCLDNCRMVLQAWQMDTLGKISLVTMSIFLVLTNLLVLLSPILSAREEKNIRFRSPVREVPIEVSALEECLRRPVMDYPSVGDALVTIKVPDRNPGDPIICNLDLGIREQANVPGMADEVTTKAKQHFLSVLPMDIEPDMRQRVRILKPKSDRRDRRTTDAVQPEPEVEETDDAQQYPNLDAGLVYGSDSAEDAKDDDAEEKKEE